MQITPMSPEIVAELARLRAIPARARWDRTRSHVALVREYLHRIALWATVCQCERDWPWVDVVEEAVPHLPESAEIARAIAEMSPSYQAKLVYKMHLRWIGARPHLKRPLSKLQPPYEPLIRLYERGGAFTWEERIIEVPGAGVHAGNINRFLTVPTPLTELDERTLDEIDTIRDGPNPVDPSMRKDNAHD